MDSHRRVTSGRPLVIGGIVCAAVLISTAAVVSGVVRMPWEASDGPSQCRPGKAPSNVDGIVKDVSTSGEFFVSGHTGFENWTLWRDGDGPVELSSEMVAGRLGYDDKNDNRAEAVNSSGHVAGVFGTGEYRASGENVYRDVAWIYRDGDVFELKLPVDLTEKAGDRRGLAITDLGDDGTVTGFLFPDTVAEEPEDYLGQDPGVVPLTWRPDASEATILDHDGDGPTYATAVHDDGSVVGIELRPTESGTSLSQGPHTVWKWDADGDRRELPFADVDFDATELEGSEFPMVAGDWVLADDQRWNMTDRDAPQKTELSPEAGPLLIDEYGTVYGNADEREPMRETDGELESLSIDGAAEYEGTRLDAVSADGRVIAGTHDPPDAEQDEASNVQAFWRCE